MTDFLHEPPAPAEPPTEPKRPESRQKRVYVYIVILFTAAFVLILWSFLATHRSNQMVLTELKSNAGILQSAIEENQALERRVGELEEETKQLRDQLDDAQRALAEAEGALADAKRADASD